MLVSADSRNNLINYCANGVFLVDILYLYGVFFPLNPTCRFASLQKSCRRNTGELNDGPSTLADIKYLRSAQGAECKHAVDWVGSYSGQLQA